jgi:hypothetical protein
MTIRIQKKTISLAIKPPKCWSAVFAQGGGFTVLGKAGKARMPLVCGE